MGLKLKTEMDSKGGDSLPQTPGSRQVFKEGAARSLRGVGIRYTRGVFPASVTQKEVRGRAAHISGPCLSSADRAAALSALTCVPVLLDVVQLEGRPRTLCAHPQTPTRPH